MSRPTYRRGTYARIVTPKVFLRCGYPMTFESARKVVLETKGEDIQRLLGIQVLPKELSLLKQDPEDWTKGKFAKQVIGALTHAHMHRHQFGGRERKIYEEDCPHLKDRIFVVSHTKHFLTGEYYPPTGHGEDFEIGGLANQKRHVIVYGSIQDDSVATTEIAFRADYLELVNRDYER